MTASTCPRRFLLDRGSYRDPAWFEQEQRLLFARSWALVGSSDQLCAPGDWLATTVGGVPLVLVIDGDGSLRAFHNMCRHRGMKMMDGGGSGCRVIRCSYQDGATT
ncbi:MAG: Rieske 2Fe-2S domain-containing protein [Actinomycetota bacterium]|nr:Rieske 2Fe-2S domain-containing protein [Actinomycetota bacterium]